MRDLARSPLLSRQTRRRRPRRRGPWPWLGGAFVLGLVALLLVWQRRPREAAAPSPTPLAVDPDTHLAATAPESGEQLEEVIAAEERGYGAGASTAPRLPFGPPDPFEPITVTLERGETLFGALVRAGLPRGEAARVVAGLERNLDMRRLRPGDRFEGTTWRGTWLIEGLFYHGRLDRYRFRRERAGAPLKVTHDPVRLRPVTTLVAGEVETSLFAAIAAAGERSALIMRFVDLFRWDFDFALETRKGDRFAMLVEKLYGEEGFFDYGPILAARYESQRGRFEACRFAIPEDPGVTGYYHPDGSSVRRAFLRAPLKYSRISSGYSLSRLHPVLGIRRPHRGVDYAAPTGTPVYAVGDGVVLDARWMGGAGKAVRIRHPNGWITSYSHLSRILVRAGQRVRQGQIIGRVGATGYATGPHLDYRIKIGGRFVNPLKVRIPAGKPIPAKWKRRFTASCRATLAELDRRLGEREALTAAR